MTDRTLRLPSRPAPAGRAGGRSGSGGRSGRRRRRPFGALVVVGVVLAAVIGVWAWWNGSVGPVAVREHCTAVAAGNPAELAPDQAGNAAIIAGIARGRGLPARAASIGIATAIQESKLRNIDYGDRDSLGLFQQRPSQGWGSREEVTDPVYATNAFYDVLAKVDGFETMPITKVAQKVQRSAFPDAYADHEPEARIIASALSGYSAGGFSCVLRPSPAAAQAPTGSGSTARARALTRAAKAETGSTGAKLAGAAGTTVRYTLTGDEAGRHAWALAHWSVARAAGLEVVRVEVADRRWVREQSTDGWTARDEPLPAGTVVITVA